MQRIVVPATSANLGPGYDCAGICLDIVNEFSFEKNTKNEIRIMYDGYGSQDLPTDERNLVVRAIRQVGKLSRVADLGVVIKVSNGIPLSRGLGSSASAIVAGLYIGNYIYGKALTDEELFNMACEMEGHPDNVAPAIFGGFCLTYRKEGQYRVKQIVPDNTIKIVIAFPNYKALTRASRKNIPVAVSMPDAIHNAVRVGLLTAGISEFDSKSLSAAMDDRLHQPYRFTMLPGVEDAVYAAISNGSCFAALSGSGPAVLAMAKAEKTKEIGEAMVHAFSRNGEGAQYIVTSPRLKGIEMF